MKVSTHISAAALTCVVVLGTAASCQPDEPLVPSESEEAEDVEPTSLAWVREIHGYDGYGKGITPHRLPSGAIAFVHDGDSATMIYHLDPVDGHTVDSIHALSPLAPRGQFTWANSHGYADEVDLLAEYGDNMTRLDLSSGRFEWMLERPYDWSPNTETDRIILGPRSGEGDAIRVYSIDASSGIPEVILERPSTGPRVNAQFINPIVFDELGESGIVAVHHKAIDWNEGPSYPDHGYRAAYSLADGRMLWRIELRDNAQAVHATRDGNNLIHAIDDTLFSVDPLTGRRHWAYWIGKGDSGYRERNSDHFFQEADPVVDQRHRRVYAGTGHRYVVAVDADTGEEVWKTEAYGARLFVQDHGDGLLSTLGTDFQTHLFDKHTGEHLATLEQRSAHTVPRTGMYYDPDTRRCYLYDGARAYCYQLNFEPPGE